ncbi:MAG: hypothetical protein K1X94_06540 [Sandaracinaceae bacterium]|jgi:hypothetical protein|nr:hypothetical protein [Sandaracinaceae bacterium]
MRPLLVSVLATLALGLTACADGSHMACRVGADCASGVCNSDGTCGRPRQDAGMGTSDTGTTEMPDAFVVTTSDSGPVPDSGARVCSPDHDGTVTRAESPLRAGLYATFRIAEDATVSTAGTTSGGARRWDLSGALSGDHDERVELLSPDGAWWAGDFPLATYAARLSASSDNLGVFQVTDTSLLLLGVVSPTDGFTQTKLTNDPPVEVLHFPLTEGSSWTSSTTVSGQALGVVTAYSEEYTFVADASGVLATPYGEIDVIRVRSELTRTQGFATLDTRRTFAFVGECFGTVATVTSQSFETAMDFTDASEVRRLAP